MCRTSFLAGLALALSVQACASAGASAAGDPSGGEDRALTREPASAAARGTSDIITEKELRDAPGTLSNAFDLIARLRPAMLQARITPGSRLGASNPTVFADNRRLGEPSLLRGIARENVRSVQYFNVAEARGRFGEGFPGGVIQVLIFKQRD